MDIFVNIIQFNLQMELHLQQEKQNQSARCEASKKSTLVQKGDCAATVNIESISEKDQPPAAIAKEVCCLYCSKMILSNQCG